MSYPLKMNEECPLKTDEIGTMKMKKMKMKKIRAALGASSARIGIFCALLFSTSLSHALIHPGGWHTQEDLTAIRENVRDEREPYITGWDLARNEGPSFNYRANVSPIITGRSALQSQGEAAYRLAMKWVASGDQRYADTAIDVINDWVRTVERFELESAVTLRLGLGGNNMAQAAEILAHGFGGAAGWEQDDIRAAQIWFKDKVYNPFTNTGRGRSSNFGTSALTGNMSMAIFCDDQDMFNDQVEAYKFGYRDTEDGCCGVAQYIFSPTGQAFESQRDQAHVQGGIGHLVEAALSAWNQGVDLVSFADNRLLAGVEYHAKYNSGNDDVPWTSDIYNPCNLRILGDRSRISPEGRGYPSPIYFMCDKLFTQAGLEHPYVDIVISDPDYLPEFSISDHPGHGQFAFVARTPSTETPSTETPSTRTVTLQKRNATGFAIDGNNGAARGQNIYLWSFDPNNQNQQWEEIDRGGGYFSYQKKGTNFSIDGGNGGARAQNVFLWSTQPNNFNQHFRKIPRGADSFQLQKRNAPDFAIDGGRGGARGQNVYLWSGQNNNRNQQWIIREN